MSLLQEIRRQWKPRPKNSHKGDFGRVCILAGSVGYSGAARLTAMAALRSGAGLVTLAIPDKIYPIVARQEADLMVRPFVSTSKGTLALKAVPEILKFLETQDVLALGPGLSQHPETQQAIRQIIAKISLPVVLDADGLNAFKNHTAELKRLAGRAILTPHAGEFSRLFGALKDRKAQARKMAKQFGFYLVLKGHGTIVASPDGKMFENTTGNPGMAKGGTGDVLTGIIAALLGQKFSIWNAACFGVYVHGAAGDLTRKSKGEVAMTASDMIEQLPETFKKILKR